MAFETIDLIPQSDEARAFFDSYPSSVETMVSIWNSFRAERFTEKKTIFGHTTADMSRESFPELLTDDFLQIRMDNEYQWKIALVESIESGAVSDDIRSTLPSFVETAEFPNETLLHDELFYDLSKFRLTIESTYGTQYEYKLSEPLKDPSQVAEMAPPVITYENGNSKLEVYVEDEVTVDDYHPSEMMGEMHTDDAFFESVYPIINLLGVYSGALDAGVFEVNSKRTDDAIELFDIMGFYYTQFETRHYTTDQFFITYDRGRQETFESFKDQHPHITLSDVDSMLGYPTDGAEDIRELRSDALAPINLQPGLEFVVYGMQTNEITPQLATYWPYVYYRPAFSIESVKNALTDARKLANAVEANKSRFNKINGDEVAPLVEEFIDTDEVHIEWPDTPSMLRPHNL